MKYARPGYRYYSVSTPSFFRELELPEQDEDMTAAERRRMASLDHDAERHGTAVHASPYKIG